MGLLSRKYGWIYPRVRPELPPGYTWEAQIKKHCPPNLLAHVKQGTPRRQHACVFAHRTLYDRALRIMENSMSGVLNGIKQHMMLHEMDGRLNSFIMFSAHDEALNRITEKKGNWNQLSSEQILQLPLVLRDIALSNEEYDSNSYLELDEPVALMDNILQPDYGHTVQVDMRENDFEKAIPWLVRRPQFYNKAMLKGYDWHYSTFKDLDTAARKRGAPANWYTIISYTFVFHSEKLKSRALEAAGVDLKGDVDYSVLSYDGIRKIAEHSIYSFINQPNQRWFVPEIGFSGLGLGYDKETDQAKNPYDGTPITDPSVVADALVDRVLLDIALELHERPDIHLGSCTRRWDVRTEKNNYTSHLQTGQFDPWPRGQKRIAFKLRGIPGGLYPETDICNADDPFAEIAARTWIEYAKLDRRKLLHMTYLDWIARAGPMVEKALKVLNGPYLANTFVRPPSNHKYIKRVFTYTSWFIILHIVFYISAFTGFWNNNLSFMIECVLYYSEEIT